MTRTFDGQKRLCVERRCGACKEKFVFPAFDKKRKACSFECRNKLSRKRMRVWCEVCDKPFEITPRYINSLKGAPVCSRECRHKAQKLDSGIIVARPRNWGRGKGRAATASIRNRAIKYNSRKLRCVSCKIKVPSLLVVHHINGNEDDNRPKNLEWVCHLHHSTRHMALSEGRWAYRTSAVTPRKMIRYVERMVERSKKHRSYKAR